jgi:hypothetical protein
MLENIITIEPCRNLISFNKFDEINPSIINKYLANILADLKLIISLDYLEDGKTNFQIRCNHINYSLQIKTSNDLIHRAILRTFADKSKCCFLEINDCIYRNNLYKDIISLEYQPKSFRQPDDSIRNYMLEWFQRDIRQELEYLRDAICIPNFTFDTMLLFGGECIMLGKILSGYSKSQYFFTDFPSIYQDIIHNYRTPNAALINYNTWKYSDHLSLISKPCEIINNTNDNIKNNDETNQYNENQDERCKMIDYTLCAVVNTGVQGMGNNLANEINNLEVNIIWVISCNKDSWNSDWQILQKKYEILEKIEIHTNYSVWIYKLSIYTPSHEPIQHNEIILDTIDAY